MSNIEIHSNIEMPATRVYQARVPRKVMDQLAVGDCFFVPVLIGSDNAKSIENGVRSSVSRMHRVFAKNGDARRFSVRRYDNERLGVWRVQ
jgi:hypothetical protein